MAYIPDRGDVAWIEFSPQAGHEQAGRRPGLVLSPKSYNRTIGLAVVCPVTSREKGYPFEVPLPAELRVSGVILTDQVRCLDWRARNASFCCRIPPDTLADVTRLLGGLLGIQEQESA